VNLQFTYVKFKLANQNFISKHQAPKILIIEFQFHIQCGTKKTGIFSVKLNDL